jgi:hypothetical protein
MIELDVNGTITRSTPGLGKRCLARTRRAAEEPEGMQLHLWSSAYG